MSALAFPTRSQTLNAAADTILKSDAKLNWISVDTSTLPPDLATAYEAYKAAQAHASELRVAFEDAACVPIGKLMSLKPGFDVAFGYRWGQLSVAAAPKRVATSKANALRF
jgi:hypothetical protein